MRSMMIAMLMLVSLLSGVSPASSSAAYPKKLPHNASRANLPPCIGMMLIDETIVIGDGEAKKYLQMTRGGWCGISLKDTELSLNAEGQEGHWAISAKTCPEFLAQMEKLSEEHDRHPEAATGAAMGQSAGRAGPFVFTYANDFFDLKSSPGRAYAEYWLRETLVAVRPCWRNSVNKSPDAVKALYTGLALPLP